MKKFLSIILVLAFAALLSACGSGDTNNSSSSSSTSSEVTSSTDTSSALKGFLDGVYYGNGFNLDIPEGYSLSSEAQAKAIFKNKNSDTLSVTYASNPSGEKTVTKEEFESGFTSLYPGSVFKDFTSTKIDGVDAYTCLLIVEASGITVYTYCAMIPTDNSIISIAMGFRNEDTEKIFQNTIETLEIN